MPQRVSYVFLPQGLWGLVHTSTPQAERRQRGRSRSRDGRKDALLDARRGLDVVGPVNQDLRLDDRHEAVLHVHYFVKYHKLQP